VVLRGIRIAEAGVRFSLGPPREIRDNLKKFGFEVFIKDGYRSKELYNLAYHKRLQKYKDDTPDKLMNMKEMPHATGLTVDIGLFDPITNKEVPTRRKEDGPESLLFDFYRHKPDQESQNLQKLQDLLKEVMCKHGFEEGRLREYFHFNYKTA
jgi:D-alanyl-D-alanine dipeptidase